MRKVACVLFIQWLIASVGLSTHAADADSLTSVELKFVLKVR